MAQTDETYAPADKATVAEVISAVDPGATILVTGPTLSGKDAIAFELLAESWTDETRPFAITTTDPVSSFRDRLAPYTPPGYRPEDVFVVDCLEASGSEDPDDPHTCAVGTPADLTGIGIELSKGYERYGTAGGRCVLLDNLATLLIYADIDRVFRFVDALTGRVTEVGDTSVHLLDGDAIDGQDRNKLLQLFSTVIEVRGHADDTVFRVRDRRETSPWYEHLPPGRSIDQEDIR